MDIEFGPSPRLFPRGMGGTSWKVAPFSSLSFDSTVLPISSASHVDEKKSPISQQSPPLFNPGLSPRFGSRTFVSGSGGGENWLASWLNEFPWNIK